VIFLGPTGAGKPTGQIHRTQPAAILGLCPGRSDRRGQGRDAGVAARAAGHGVAAHAAAASGSQSTKAYFFQQPQAPPKLFSS
jgi:hypothetical protein